MEYFQIYNTVNIKNCNNYVGQHNYNTLEKDKYIGSGNLLKRAIKKHGKVNFKKYILDVCETKEQANFLEKRYIAFYKRGGFCKYNISDGGQGGIMIPPVTGWKHTKEAKDKISKKNSGNKYCLGRVLSEETKIKIGIKSKNRKPCLGLIRTEESKQKQRDKMKGKEPWNKGLTKETDERVKKYVEKSALSNIGRISWNKGLKKIK